MTYIMGRVFAKTIEEALQHVFARMAKEGLRGEPRIKPASVQPNPELIWWEYGVLGDGT